MRVKVLAEDSYRVVAVLNADECPAEAFILEGEASTRAARSGLLEMIGHVASRGLQNVSSTWFHEVDKKNGIYEFIKGPLRLFFFKGNGTDIAICTSGVRKSGQKVDSQSVAKAAKWRADYFAAQMNNTYEVVEDET